MAMLPWWIHYPNVNNEIINLDWILQISNENTDKIENFIGVNTIKYADPILWDITSQYEANTIVVDPQTGDAYISTKAVPYGVALSNEGYWTRIYNYASEIHIFREQIAADEQLSTTATAPRSVDDLVFLNGLLYIVTATIIAGDSYVEGSNCAKTTINAQLLRLHTSINSEAQAREDADTALGGRIDDEIQAREDADTALGQRIDELDINHVYNQSTPESGLTSNIGLKEGTYDITEDLTINAQLVIPKGAVLNIASGVTLTINGQILAGRYQIFSGDGSVVVNAAYQPVGYPEWFGAIADDNTDCTNAIQKCIDVFKETSLTNGTYKITDTIKVTSAYKTIKGFGIWRGATVVKLYDASKTILQLGPNTQPSQINSFLQEIRVENIEFTRNTTDWKNGSVGIDCRWILRSNLLDVMSSESSVPFYIHGCVYTKFIRCTAFSTTLASGDTTRQFAGFRLTASTSIGSAGGNASIYILNCSSTTGGTIYLSSWSVQAYGNYGVADLYIDKLESNGVAYGIVVAGNNGRNSAHDILITNCVIDAIKQTGIQIANCAFGTVTVANNYITVGANSSVAFGIHVSSCVNCTFSNNQIIGSVATSDVYGIYIQNSITCNFIGNMIYECELSHYIEGSINCLLEDSVYNEATRTTYVVSVQSGSNHNIKCNIKAKSSYLVRLNNGVTRCAIDATLLNTGDVSSGVIVIAGNTPTANGYFNNNYITGYFIEPTP